MNTSRALTASDTTASPQADSTPERCMVCLDIDGTLTDDGARSVPPATVAAVERARAVGHHVVLASGRSLVGILPIAAVLGITDGWVVASNGAVTARLDPHATGGYVLTDVHTFDPEPVLRRVLVLMPQVNLAVEKIGQGYRVRQNFGPGGVNGVQEVVGLADLWSVPITRAVVRGPGAVARLLGPLGELGVTVKPVADDWLDVTPRDLSKASALEKVRRRLGVPARSTVAVGDGVNDVEMLAWAARGVAMGHACAQVRAGADEVTGTLADGGVRTVLAALPMPDQTSGGREAFRQDLIGVLGRCQVPGGQTVVQVRLAGTGPGLASCEVWTAGQAATWTRRASITLPDPPVVATMQDIEELCYAGFTFKRTMFGRAAWLWHADTAGKTVYRLTVTRP